MIAKWLKINADTSVTRFFLFFRVYLFFFWILIYIGKEGKMKKSRNDVPKVFCIPVGWGFLVGVFVGFLALGVFGVFGIYMVT